MSWWLVPEVLIFGAVWIWLVGLIPAAVVCLLKERLAMFFAGFLTLGITWFLGAVPLAEAHSGWARRFYGKERLARATDPVLHPRPARATAYWLGGSAALLLVVGIFTARPTPIIGVDGKALQYSVGGGSLLFDSQPCPHEANDTWTCGVYNSAVSGTVTYRVRVGGLGCWTAIRSERVGVGSPRRLSGCLTAWDQLRLFDQLL